MSWTWKGGSGKSKNRPHCVKMRASQSPAVQGKDVQGKLARNGVIHLTKHLSGASVSFEGTSLSGRTNEFQVARAQQREKTRSDIAQTQPLKRDLIQYGV